MYIKLSEISKESNDNELKRFFNNSFVETNDNTDELLISYYAPVGIRHDNMVLFNEFYYGYSATTNRHMNAFSNYNDNIIFVSRSVFVELLSMFRRNKDMSVMVGILAAKKDLNLKIMDTLKNDKPNNFIEFKHLLEDKNISHMDLNIKNNGHVKKELKTRDKILINVTLNETIRLIYTKTFNKKDKLINESLKMNKSYCGWYVESNGGVIYE